MQIIIAIHGQDQTTFENTSKHQWRNESESELMDESDLKSELGCENSNFLPHTSSIETIVSWITIISRVETECAIVCFQDKVTFERPSLKEAALRHAAPHGGKETLDETWWVKAFGSKGTGESAGMYLSDVEKWHLKNQAVYGIDCPSFSTSHPAFVTWNITEATSGKD